MCYYLQGKSLKPQLAGAISSELDDSQDRVLPLRPINTISRFNKSLQAAENSALEWGNLDVQMCDEVQRAVFSVSRAAATSIPLEIYTCKHGTDTSSRAVHEEVLLRNP